MMLLPYENYSITTKLTPSGAMAKLKENIIITSWPVSNRKIKTTRPFSGVIDRDSFRIARITWYINSFAPIILGQIHDNAEETIIHVKMKMHIVITLITIIWMGGASLALAASITNMFEQKKFDPIVFVVIGFVMAGYGLCLTGFKYESSKSKKILADLFCNDSK